MTVINLGCGTRKEKGHIGVDIVKWPDTDVVWDLNDHPYPFENESADMIIAEEIIEHLKDPKRFMEEVHRILKPGGKVRVTTNNKNSLINKMFKTYNVKNHISLQSPESMKALLGSGWNVEKHVHKPYVDQNYKKFRPRYHLTLPFRYLIHFVLPKSLQERIIIEATKQ
jgi:SAM-dependent methyltransferase